MRQDGRSLRSVGEYGRTGGLSSCRLHLVREKLESEVLAILGSQ